ncbi:MULTISPECIES: acyl-CoA dehydrogenase [Oceanimonas]|uniref:Acyl-coenzyme A dehydrogenase n=1 Tax=Oceanimonas doudoroffii TaxID=84158 RepID=A0A233RHC2_9GAMM|nr:MULTISPECIES: acyl-CoA dehydrogenase [Oceanimonas]NHI00606.1 Acyl-coenzyme A dehydrogenase [Oceanimonas sp. MB9]OXY82796.1 acyl-CoA dehydrogenase [Oceanimonas doudoroffii]
MSLRKKWISGPAFATFKKVLPPLSATEREAMEAGSVWWDGELFSGRPDWSVLLSYGPSRLSEREQSFLDNEVETLLAMLDEHRIVSEERELPEPVWDYLRHHGFFSLIIPKSYGGLDFSAFANSTIVGRIASRSISAAVTVMVPNSLGPGELLMHYGTEAQKQRWLPGLANGAEIPCFALTGPEAGSDAGSIPDSGVVCRGEFEGEQVLGLRLNWDKRYITLAPRATVLGLAFKLYDPEGLLGDSEELGITCALIPTSHPGVHTGERHFPMGQAFLNGTTRGKDVFIPLDWIIGGPDYAGRGWRMLVECLSAGRGISLPALGTACGHLATRSTSAYAVVRKQFGLSIGRFEGVQEALARIGGLTYQLEAARRLTTRALDMDESPAIVTAISKYHMTEMARTVINDAMDVHAGKAIQLGPKNYLAHNYMSIPIAITVEGANILTRNLMIFGQGASRCHPYVLKELEAAANPDEQAGLEAFDRLLFRHARFAAGNALGALWQGLTGARFNGAPVSGETAQYFRQLARMSRALALCADVSMLTLGGDLKRREMLSARLGDVLSHLYLGSATLKFFEDNGRPEKELPFVHYALARNLHAMGEALTGFLQNFPNRALALTLKALIFPLGNRYRPPADRYATAICRRLMTPGGVRDRLSALCYLPPASEPGLGEVEAAFVAMVRVMDIEKKVLKAQKDGLLPRKLALTELLQQARRQNLLTDTEAQQLREADELRRRAIAVDEFAVGELSRQQSRKRADVA